MPLELNGDLRFPLGSRCGLEQAPTTETDSGGRIGGSMHALEAQLSGHHRAYQHRKHDIKYSFVDNGNGTFSPVALIFGADRVPCVVDIPADVHFRQPLQAANRALVEAVMAVDERIGR